jgi:hypothetical protein
MIRTYVIIEMLHTVFIEGQDNAILKTYDFLLYQWISL